MILKKIDKEYCDEKSISHPQSLIAMLHPEGGAWAEQLPVSHGQLTCSTLV
jgi:hypothetical protein